MIRILHPEPTGDALEIIIEGTARHLCPFTGQPDIDQVTVTYNGNDGLIEAASLVNYLDSLADTPITSEQLASTVRAELSDDLPTATVTVTGSHVDGRIKITATAR